MKMIDFNMLGLMQHLSPTFRKLERNMDLNFCEFKITRTVVHFTANNRRNKIKNRKKLNYIWFKSADNKMQIENQFFI